MKKQNILAKIILVIFSVLTLNLNIALSHDCISYNEQKTNCIYTKSLIDEPILVKMNRNVLEIICKIDFYIQNWSSECPECKKNISEVCKSYTCYVKEETKEETKEDPVATEPQLMY
jgi:hypothetical protein